ncbi:hypothetical protein BH09BAC5_BH09BAC5_29330 [soil metagenome]
MKTQINQALKNAFELFQQAESELNRPKEDAVTICACNCTRDAVRGLMHSFLLANTVKISANESLAELLNQCKKHETQFEHIDLSCFDCKNEKTDSRKTSYCLPYENVNKCFQVAQMLRDIIIKNLSLSQNNLM